MDDYLVRAASASPVISLSNPNTISDSDDTTTANNPTPINQATPICSGAIVVSGNGGGSSTSARKPRGRPPGSKNKPKPPVVITRDSESAMKPVILELASGCDIMAALSGFSARRRAVVSVLSASGAVTNVTFRHPNSPSSNMMSFIIPGRFDLLSLSGNMLPPSTSSHSTVSTNAGFSILMAGPQGQVIGGTLAGSLTAADTVMIVAAVYSSPEIHHLPSPVETEEADVVGGAAGETGGKKVKSEGGGQHEAPLYGGPVGMVIRPEMALWSSQPPPPPPASAPQY